MTNQTTPPDHAMIDDLSLVSEIVRAMRDSLTIRETLEHVVSYMAKTFGVSDCSICLFDRYTEQSPLATLYLSSPEAESISYTLPIGSDFYEYCRQLQSPVRVTDTEIEPVEPSIQEIAWRNHYRSFLLVPLGIKGQVVGSLNMASRVVKHDFTDREVRLACAAAELLGLMMDQARLLEENRRTGELYQALFEGVSEGILVIDEQDRYRAVNAAACAMFGYSREELLQMHIQDLLLPWEIPLLEEYRPRLYSGQSLHVEFSLRRQDGSIIPVELSAQKIAVGGKTLYIGIHRDLSERRRAEGQLRQQVAQLQGLYRTSLDLTRQMTTQHLLEAIVARAVNLLRASMGGIYLCDEETQRLTLTVGHNVPPHLIGTYVRIGEGATGRVAQTGEAANIPNYGEVKALYGDLPHPPGIVALLSVPLHWEARIIGALNIADQDSERAFTEEEKHLLEAFANHASLAIVQARMIEQIRAANDELRRANEALQALDRMKDNFLAMITDELRRPLTDARLGVEVALEGRRGLDARQSEMLDLALHSIDVQRKLVDDLLLMTRLRESSVAYMVRLDLRELLHEATAIVESGGREKALSLELDLPEESVPVQCDPPSLCRALVNLLTNALKFNPEGGRIHTSLNTDADQTAVIRVQDSGIGIPGEYHERIFDRFFQIDNSNTRDYEGLGLGLALVKEIVEQHGGQVGVESTLGQGSTFTIRLPIYR